MRVVVDEVIDESTPSPDDVVDDLDVTRELPRSAGAAPRYALTLAAPLEGRVRRDVLTVAGASGVAAAITLLAALAVFRRRLTSPARRRSS